MRLPLYHKRPEAFYGYILNLYVIDLCRGRSFAAPRLELLQHIGGSFCMDFYVAILGIADPAGDAQFICLLLCGFAKENALDEPTD